MTEVLLIEQTPSIPSLGESIVMPRYGLLTIASILSEKTNYKVRLHFESYAGEIRANDIAEDLPKFILINGLTTTSIKNEKLINELRILTNRPPIIIAGGEHATMFPEDVIRYVDYVILYEGDQTVLELLKALEEKDLFGRNMLISRINGLYYRDVSGIIKINNEPERVKKIDYRYNLEILTNSKNAKKHFRLSQVPLQTSRGCKYVCSFCSWISLFGKTGYILRPIDDILHDISHTIEHMGINDFMIVDNLFGGNINYTKELLQNIIESNEQKKIKPKFTVLCRASQIAGSTGDKKIFSDNFLRLMKRAGVTNVSLGLESTNDYSLEQMGKKSDEKMYRSAANRLHKHELNIAATFVTGYGQERPEDVLKIADFAEQIGCFTIQIYCHSITPNTKDEKTDGYLQFPVLENQYLNGHAVTTFPRRMLPSQLQKAVFKAAFLFYEKPEPQRRIIYMIYKKIWKALSPYYSILEQMENEILIPQGYYHKDRRGNYSLEEDKLYNVVSDHVKKEDFTREIKKIFKNKPGQQ